MRRKIIALLGVSLVLLCGCNDSGESSDESSFVKGAITNADSPSAADVQTEETTEAETIPRLSTVIAPISEKTPAERTVITALPKMDFEDFEWLNSRDESKIENTKEDQDSGFFDDTP